VSRRGGGWLVSSRPVNDIVEELGGSGVPPTGIPTSRLVDLRHELTALINSELYGGGNKIEGRAALMARRSLDEFIFHTKQSQLVRGNVADNPHMIQKPKRHGVALPTPFESNLVNQPSTIQDSALVSRNDA